MDQREIALHCAIETLRIKPEGTDVLAAAASYAVFLAGNDVPKEEAPKATRQSRKTTATAATDTASNAQQTAVETSSVATASPSDKETDDLFGNDEPAKVEEKKAPKLTIDNVKAKLVEVQTALGHKDHAIALLAKHTVPKGTKVLSSLPEGSWAALIAEADKSIKAGKVA